MLRSKTRNPDLDPTGRVPQHQLGKIEIGGTKYQLLRLGDWSSVPGYVPGNLVSDTGVDYVCISANTNDEPPSGSWQVFDETMYFLDARRVWSQLTQPTGAAEEHLIGAQTVAGGSHDFVSLGRYDGAVLLDLTDPTKPLFLTNGIYAITAMIQVAGASATTTLSTMTLQVVQAAATWPPGGYDTGRAPGRYLQPPVGGGGDLFLEEHRTAKFFTGSSDFFRVLFANDDPVSWDIQVSVAVTSIVTFT